MTSLWLALYVTGVFLWRTGLTNQRSSALVNQDSGFKLAKVGDNVTLRCFYEGGSASMFHWYKQTLGQKLRHISTFYRHDKKGTFTAEFRNLERFSLETGHGNNHLTISDLHISDSATYYCIGCSATKSEFGEGVTISVEGSVLNIHQPEGSVNVSCTVHTRTCDGGRSVYWFRDSEESHPGLIYTHGDRNDQCESKPDTQTHTCVYNLLTTSPNLSHGMSYCAVASCGHILFGNRTKPDHEDKVTSLLYFLSGALVFTIILSASLLFSLYKIIKGGSCHCTESQTRFSAPSAVNTECDEDSGNLHYAALRIPRVNPTTRQRDETQGHCVYSTVRP